MLDKGTDNISRISLDDSNALEQLYDVYEHLFFSYSVRTQNILNSVQQDYPDKQSFIIFLLTAEDKDLLSLRKCGKKTAEEIKDISLHLRNRNQSVDLDSILTNKNPYGLDCIPGNIDTLFPIVTRRLEESSMSVRSKNGIILFFKEHNNSLKEVYKSINSVKFSPTKLKNIGKRCVEEVGSFFTELQSYIESFVDTDSVDSALRIFNTKTLTDLNIPFDSQDGITSLEQQLGYFPLFAVIQAYIEGLDVENRTIINDCMRIYEGQEIKNKDSVGAGFGLTGERIRQKRRKLIDSFTEYFGGIQSMGFVGKCPYKYQMTHVNDLINNTEGTNFNLDFVNWAIGSTYEDVTVLGDVMKSITGFYENKSFLCLVPSYLCEYMDFNAFIDDVNAHLSEKRIEEEKVDLSGIIKSHLKVQYCDDELPSIETACRSILYLNYPVEVDYGCIIFKQNARKNNPIVIEEIIRAAGHPLSLEEIYEEFLYQYPDRYTELRSFRGNLSNNPNVIPIGRTSTYTLAEWQEGEYRGGSIRGIIAEYLKGLNPTIALFTDVVKYVCEFRPTTDEDNILSNISLDKSGTFQFFYREGNRYLGLAAFEYSIEFFPIIDSSKNAASMSLYYPKLIQYIEDHGCFPGSIGEREEVVLYQFWRRQIKSYESGTMDPHAQLYYDMINERYGNLYVDKKRLSWEKHYRHVRLALRPDSNALLSDKDSEWIKQLFEEYTERKESIPAWRMEKTEEILKLLVDFLSSANPDN